MTPTKADTAPLVWSPVHNSGSWGIATTDTPGDMTAALALPGSWPIDKSRLLVRRDQWGNLPTAPPPGPALTSVNPNTGDVAGGTACVLSGSGLTGATQVFFGGIAAVSFAVTNDTTVAATSPPATGGNPGPVNVNVMRGVASNPVTFTYVGGEEE
jgi:IPT/TIG domain